MAIMEDSGLSVRIVTADFYLSPPLKEFDEKYSMYRGSDIKRVPIIRIFGSTNEGDKTCLHVRGVFPYIYVPYDGSQPPERTGYQIVFAVEKALNILLGSSLSGNQHIYQCTLVSKKPIYGYHRKEHQFYKIDFYNPVMAKKAAELLLNGAILNKAFQPYEAHIPYVLQFLIDFNLQGMNYLHMKRVKYRRHPRKGPTCSAEPQSTCEVEVDCVAADILNANQLHGEIEMNPGLAALWQEERDRRKALQMNEDTIAPPLTQERTNVDTTDSEVFYKQMLDKRLTELTETQGDLSMSFAEVNNQLETTLPVESPDDEETLTQLLHGTAVESEEDADLVAILSQMARENDLDDSFVNADAILASQETTGDEDRQSVPKSFNNRNGSESSESDGERETHEMTQVFWTEPEEQVLDTENESEYQLPNVDGAFSSSDEDSAKTAIKPKKSRTRHYDPLDIRILPKKMRKEPRSAEDSTSTVVTEASARVDSVVMTEQTLSAAHLGNDSVSSTRRRKRNSSKADYDNVLYKLGFPSPAEPECRCSPPQPVSPEFESSCKNSQDQLEMPTEQKQSHVEAIHSSGEPSSSAPSDKSKDLFHSSGADGTPALGSQLTDSQCSSVKQEQHESAKDDLPELATSRAPFWGNPEDVEPVKNLLGQNFKIDCKPPEPVSYRLIKGDRDSYSSQGQNPEVSFILTSQEHDFLVDVDKERKILLRAAEQPPSKADLLQARQMKRAAPKAVAKPGRRRVSLTTSQLEAPTLNNSYGFKMSFGNWQEAKAVHQFQFLTVMCMEIHVGTREDLQPDPSIDPIQAVFYMITNDVPVESDLQQEILGAIVVDSQDGKNMFQKAGVPGYPAETVSSENELLEKLVLLIELHNPDMLVGYEIELLSWGYVLDRGKHLNLNLSSRLSRVPSAVVREKSGNSDENGDFGYMAEKNSDIVVPGRIVLNLWRLLRVEIALQSYTFENLVFHVLHQRIPTYSFQSLQKWWESNLFRWQVIEHYTVRVKLSWALIEQLDLIGRTSELARLFGIQFYEVLTRGSQFRVESMMLRLAKPLNFVPVSPSMQQRAHMRAPEWLPLIMEPKSRLYTDPVVVLDFQSLYPSMIIAYNYCFSTCLGRVQLLGKNEPFEFGCSQLLVPPELIRRLHQENLINVSPAGIAFVKASVRQGILPRMLDEILSTRIMVKQSMKEYKEDRTLQRVFDSRQLGLKLIANVTYGYTSANFSGRMPSVEVGDSVVSKGRETLERAIHLIEATDKWGAKVVYGDTDSIFVLLPGKSRAEAFAIGKEIADTVTQRNPKPVKLKFEKVYQPCILQTKKRYVGYKFESENQEEPIYEAKGIETVRRDGCPAVVKLLEKSLRILFETLNLSLVKSYVQRQFTKILENRINLQDFIFAREYRGVKGYKPGACVPALEIAKCNVRTDPRSEPRVLQRVPYVIVYGPPGLPLIRLVRKPQEVLADPSLRLNAEYYITRVITPPLQRCFGLLGLDLSQWYKKLPRTQQQASFNGINAPKATISQYFASNQCLLCTEPIYREGLCYQCLPLGQTAVIKMSQKIRSIEKNYAGFNRICSACAGASDFGQSCTSLDCPVLYKRVPSTQQLSILPKLQTALEELAL